MSQSSPDLQHINWFLQKDRIDFLKLCHGEQWVTAYESVWCDQENFVIFCALIPIQERNKVLQNETWDLSVGHGVPDFMSKFIDGHWHESYNRFGGDQNIEPFVIIRSFHSLKPTIIEVCEEFRFFHNLYFDSSSSTYLQIIESGDQRPIVKLDSKKVTVARQPLLEFITAKRCYFATYIDSVRYSVHSMDSFAREKLSHQVRSSQMTARFRASANEISLDKTHASFSRLLGKRPLGPVASETIRKWRKARDPKYLKFKIRHPKTKRIVEHSCDPAKLSDFFGKNPGKPNFLTPVYFRHDVLGKYFNDPSKYKVEDGFLRCGSLWGLRIDNDHPTHVIVFLGDIGEGLPYQEQIYWKAFNDVPGDGISQTNFKRSFKAEFAEPERSDLKFKATFQRFQKGWLNKFGWYLFVPLENDDLHHLISLRIPINPSQKEFDEQVLSVVKVTLDSINVLEIRKRIDKHSIREGAGPVDYLKAFLIKNDYDASEQDVVFLRRLQQLRSSGVAHRKGKKFDRAMRELNIDPKALAAGFDSILIQWTAFLGRMNIHFLGATLT